MANPPCMADDGNPSVFTGTFLTSGQAVMVCEDHLVAFCVQTLSELSQVPPEAILRVVSEDVPGTSEGAPSDEPPPAAPADPDPTATPDPPKRGRTRKGSAGPGTENGQADGLREGSPADSSAPAV
jgi:hypothetical protein